MKQLTRRNFLKVLAGLPALALLKPSAPKPDYSPSLEAIKAFSKMPSGFFEGIKIGLGASGDALLEQTRPVVEAMAEQVTLELVQADEEIYLDLTPPGRQIRWNGAGDSWESIDGGKSWTQTNFRPALEVQPDGTLYVSGAFLQS